MGIHRPLVLGLVLFAATGNALFEYSYEDDAPDQFAEQYPTCGGQRQSPVNIQLNRTKKTTSPALWMDFPSYIPWPTNLTNNGHTSLLQLDSALPITLHGGPLEGPYVFQQMHFHWGSNDSVGSQHAVNSHFSAMEMHMVFYKEEYGSPVTAANHSDGFAFVATLLELHENDNPLLTPIVSALGRVPNTGDVTTLSTGLALQALLPHDRHLFFTYPGSFAMPPCDEAVIWNIFTQRIPVSSEQVAAFRTLRKADGSFLVSNRRPLQPLGNRTVSWVSFGFSRHRSAHTKGLGHHSRLRQ